MRYYNTNYLPSVFKPAIIDNRFFIFSTNPKHFGPPMQFAMFAQIHIFVSRIKCCRHITCDKKECGSVSDNQRYYHKIHKETPRHYECCTPEDHDDISKDDFYCFEVVGKPVDAIEDSFTNIRAQNYDYKSNDNIFNLPGVKVYNNIENNNNSQKKDYNKVYSGYFYNKFHDVNDKGFADSRKSYGRRFFGFGIGKIKMPCRIRNWASFGSRHDDYGFYIQNEDLYVNDKTLINDTKMEKQGYECDESSKHFTLAKNRSIENDLISMVDKDMAYCFNNNDLSTWYANTVSRNAFNMKRRKKEFENSNMCSAKEDDATEHDLNKTCTLTDFENKIDSFYKKVSDVRLEKYKNCKKRGENPNKSLKTKEFATSYINPRTKSSALYSGQTFDQRYNNLRLNDMLLSNDKHKQNILPCSVKPEIQKCEVENLAGEKIYRGDRNFTRTKYEILQDGSRRRFPYPVITQHKALEMRDSDENHATPVLSIIRMIWIAALLLI